MDWSLAESNADLLSFTRYVIALRAAHPVFRRRRFFSGRPAADGSGGRDIVWLTPTAVEMTNRDWDSGFERSLAAHLNGDAIREPNHRGERVRDDSFLLCFNADRDTIDFTVPDDTPARWIVVLDTSVPTGRSDRLAEAGATVPVPGRSLTVLRWEV